MAEQNLVTVNLKLTRRERNDFKETAKRKGHKSMQLVLSAFISSYIQNPDQFVIQLGVKGNGSPIRKESAIKS